MRVRPRPPEEAPGGCRGARARAVASRARWVPVTAIVLRSAHQAHGHAEDEQDDAREVGWAEHPRVVRVDARQTEAVAHHEDAPSHGCSGHGERKARVADEARRRVFVLRVQGRVVPHGAKLGSRPAPTSELPASTCSQVDDGTLHRSCHGQSRATGSAGNICPRGAYTSLVGRSDCRRQARPPQATGSARASRLRRVRAGIGRR